MMITFKNSWHLLSAFYLSYLLLCNKPLPNVLPSVVFCCFLGFYGLIGLSWVAFLLHRTSAGAGMSKMAV